MSIGDSLPRVDGPPKTTGETRFTADLTVENLWYGVTVRSPVAHGTLRELRRDGTFCWDSVVVVTAKDIPGTNVVRIIEMDMPCLAHERVNYLGEPVALIAAPNLALAREAKAHLAVVVDELPAQTDFSALINRNRDGADTPPLLSEIRLRDGDVSLAEAHSDHVVSGVYRMSAQEHAYLEPQSMIAFPPDEHGTTRVLGSMQCPYYVRPAVAHVLGCADDAVRVEQAPTGGAFGGKEDFPSHLACHVALLARQAKHPVRMVYEREEDMAFTTKRHPAWVHLTSGVSRDGRLNSLRAEIFFDGGAYVTLTPVVLSRGLLHACGAYRFGAVDIHGVALRTNLPPAGAFRGFGAPQTLTAIECHLDDIAAKLGLSALELRQRNLLQAGSRMATGQILTESVGAADCLDDVVIRSGYRERCELFRCENEGSHAQKRGIGLSVFLHGGGFTGNGEKAIVSPAALLLHPDATVEVLASNTEMGQGLQTVFQQIVADTLAIPVHQIRSPLPNTARVPNSGPTVASRSTMIVGRVLELAARKLIEDLLSAHPAGSRYENGCVVTPDGRTISFEQASVALTANGPHRADASYDFPKDQVWDDATHKGSAYTCYSWGAAAVEVVLDMETGETRPTDIWLAYDIGRAVNPLLARGQLEGGSLQALGYGLCENLVVQENRYLQDRFQTYIVPTSADAPRFHLNIVEKPYSKGPGGAKGLGELPMNGVAAALRNAVLHACGKAVNTFPLIPERVLNALMGKEERHA